MKVIKMGFAPVLILSALIVLPACKAKKLAQKPAAPAEAATPPPAPMQKPQPVAVQTPPPPPVQKPDYNFSNIQFDFNSAVLKTESYTILDKITAAMKADPSLKFS